MTDRTSKLARCLKQAAQPYVQLLAEQSVLQLGVALGTHYCLAELTSAATHYGDGHV